MLAKLLLLFIISMNFLLGFSSLDAENANIYLPVFRFPEIHEKHSHFASRAQQRNVLDSFYAARPVIAGPGEVKGCYARCCFRSSPRGPRRASPPWKRGQNFANFWRARSRLYQNESLQENMANAFDSIFQALQDLHPFAPLQSQNFHKTSV